MTLINFLLFNLQGLEQGHLSVSINPCLPNGQILTEEYFIDQPDALLNRPYNFKVNSFRFFLLIR
jgi:hypothetical protein